MIVYWCTTCNKVGDPYHGDPDDPTCQKCGDVLQSMDSKIVLKLAKYIQSKKISR